MTQKFESALWKSLMSRGMSNSFNDFVDTQLLDLRERFGMAMWFLIRRRGEEWLTLRTCGEGYDLASDDLRAWPGRLGYHQSGPKAPLIRADTGAGQHHASPAHSPPIGAYLCLPLFDQHGHLFGVLCALDPVAQPHLRETAIQTALDRQSHLLETALVWNLAGLDQQRITDFFEEEGRDPETGLLDASGWIRILDRERERCRDYGLNAMVLRVHGGDHTDARHEPLADSLAALIRQQDMVAHLGEGQFAILLTESTPYTAARTRERILDALHAKGLWVECEPEPLKLESGVSQPGVLLDGALH